MQGSPYLAWAELVRFPQGKKAIAGDRLPSPVLNLLIIAHSDEALRRHSSQLDPALGYVRAHTGMSPYLHPSSHLQSYLTIRFTQRCQTTGGNRDLDPSRDQEAVGTSRVGSPSRLLEMIVRVYVCSQSRTATRSDDR